jgi:hypothetical protein
MMNKPNVLLAVACLTNPNMPVGVQVYSNYKELSYKEIESQLKGKTKRLDPTHYNFESNAHQPVKVLYFRMSGREDNAGIDIADLLERMPND